MLEQRVIPRLFEDKRRRRSGARLGRRLRDRRGGLFDRDAAGRVRRRPRRRAAIQMFATDIDEQALAVAREGCYTEADVADVPTSGCARSFTRGAAATASAASCARWCCSRSTTCIRDPPFSHLDLMACRNLLIYLNRAVAGARARDVPFRAAARRLPVPRHVGDRPTAPATCSCAFDKQRAHLREPRIGAGRIALPPTPIAAAAARRPRGRRSRAPAERLVAGGLHQRLLEQLRAAVGRRHRGHRHRARVRARRRGSCRSRGGEPSRDLCKLVRPELRLDLRTALHQAAQSARRVEVRGVQLSRPTAARVGRHLTVRPVLATAIRRAGYFLVLFEERERRRPPAERADAADQPGRAADAAARRGAGARQDAAARDDRAVRDAGRGAKASNEELQAINEELRSSTEELETSKEELQSVNEELTTVNQELKIKIEELRLDQQRPPEPDQLHRHRDDLPRPRAAHEAAPRRARATSSTCSRPTSAGRCRTSRARSLRRLARRRAAGARTLQTDRARGADATTAAGT